MRDQNKTRLKEIAYIEAEKEHEMKALSKGELLLSIKIETAKTKKLNKNDESKPIY